MSALQSYPGNGGFLGRLAWPLPHSHAAFGKAGRGLQVFLAKVGTGSEKQLAQQFAVRNLPTVKIFRHGKVVYEFMGVPASLFQQIFWQTKPPNNGRDVALPNFSPFAVTLDGVRFRPAINVWVVDHPLTALATMNLHLKQVVVVP